MYFLLAAVVEKFYLLKYGLAIILTFIGVKMLGESFFHIDILISLAVVVGLLIASVVASMIWPRPEEAPEPMRPEQTPTGSLFGTIFSRKRKDRQR
jgi:predicted tellurium resistance membrane protein TerC